MSVSQKGEAAIIRGLDADDDFERYLSEPLEDFRRRATSAMPDRSQPADADTWRATLKGLIGKLADDLLWSIEALASSVAPPSSEAEDSAAAGSTGTPTRQEPSRGAQTPPSPKRTRRNIDI